MSFLFYRQIEQYVRELDELQQLLSKKDGKVSKLENEVFVYQQNYKVLSDQLQELQQVNQDLQKQVRGKWCLHQGVRSLELLVYNGHAKLFYYLRCLRPVLE